MDRADRPIRRWPWIAAAALLGGVAAVWAMLPDGYAARIERRADCYDPAALPPVETLADGRKAMRLRVLLWNVEGLPWPIRSGRGEKLEHIADWIAKRRAGGHGPDLLFLHKAFTPEASRIAVAGGYRSIVPGPAVDQTRTLQSHPQPTGYAEKGHWWKGEHVGKWLDSGLYIATDLPVLAMAAEPFAPDSCAGFDCLANKGGLAMRVAVPGAPAPLTLFNTHRNSREPSGVAIDRAELAHRMQTQENDYLASRIRYEDAAWIAAGDFNNYRLGDRKGRFARDRNDFRLVAKGQGFAARPAEMTDLSAWAGASDLLGFKSSEDIRVEPLAIATLFDGKNGPRLSDHDAQYIVFRISWAASAPPAPVAVKPCSA